MSNLIKGTIGYIVGFVLLIAALFIDEGIETIVVAIMGATCIISTDIDRIRWELEKHE